MKILLWADDPDMALPVRATLREQGHGVMIRDARAFFGFQDCEPTDALGFVSASKEAQILSEYRSQQFVERHGTVRVLDIKTGAFGEAIEIPDLKIEKPPSEPTEKDLLAQRLDNLSDDDLRTYARAQLIGQDIPPEAGREDLEAAIRTGKFVSTAAPKDPPADAPAPPSAPAGASAAQDDPDKSAAAGGAPGGDAGGKDAKADKPGRADKPPKK